MLLKKLKNIHGLVEVVSMVKRAQNARKQILSTYATVYLHTYYT
jgi:hypothetical protein